MRIAYIAHFGPHDNQDEEAISHALVCQGHDVVRIDEDSVGKPEKAAALTSVLKDVDLLLFHKCCDWGFIRSVKCRKVFWFFDLVETADRLLRPRSLYRMDWIRDATRLADLGFCTDGDWVAKDGTGKLHHLMQGADERVVGFGTSRPELSCDVLFTGMARHGLRRLQHVQTLKQRYGSAFKVVGDGGPRTRIHGRQLADQIASAKVVVAPSGPVSNRYWSNRVYLMLGFGGCLVHPHCSLLTDHYSHGDHLLYYHNLDMSFAHIDRLLAEPHTAAYLGMAGYERTMQQHLYRHRVAQMLDIIKAKT